MLTNPDLFSSRSAICRHQGSPADRDDCDEILQINGKSFTDNVSHAEIVQHIHEVSSPARIVVVGDVIVTPEDSWAFSGGLNSQRVGSFVANQMI